MTRSFQSRLSDFGEVKEETPKSKPKLSKPPVKRPKPVRKLWKKTTNKDEEWGVVNLDDTVLFVQLINGRIHAHGMEAVCKWCEGHLEIREETKVFCGGKCGRYQGEFSSDTNDFLRWEGVKSYTLRKIVAEVEALELEARDLEPISYAPNWSILYEYEDESENESLSKD
ncbi:MAG: hypothetical protein ACFFFK_10435 [Candidatus Thorarchaeota archaeon]